MSLVIVFDKRNEDHRLEIMSSVKDGRPFLRIHCIHSHPAYGNSYLNFELDQKQIKRLKDSIDTE